MAFSRSDTSVLGRWWWTVDRWTLAALMTLIAFGYVMMLAASPAVAERIGASSRHMFFVKQVAYLAMAAGLMVAVSLLSVKGVRRFALLGFAAALVLTAATLVVGVEIKGARRWLPIPGLSLQPSEFLKPFFAVVAGWLIAEGKLPGSKVWGASIAVGLFLMVAVILKGQPDIGMLLVVCAVFFAQFFVAGMNLFLVGAVGGLGIAGAVGAYLIFPHVQSRVHRFLDPSSGDSFQVSVALEAFANGGLLGRGPGEGRVKNVLPDAHADFVFAVAGEEFGMVLCLVILAVFAFIVVRGLMRLLGETDLFVMLAGTGLLTQFGLQAFVNMASTLHLIPTKGMTLPFVSYGGSSVLAIAIGMGMLLALTRRRTGSRAGEDTEHAQPPVAMAAGGAR
ncbi:FtsW/RodA/SpoVE family cell cycle protein [Roseomonas sp. CECT 9278]|uniref:FtsW/RodA/SpoVE family cell cycle protein n=1 Tax=Roseomonas sp. CECT 9278 TaxID=2845823 RepID=UPI001E4035AA|nr:putative peptidoglycan glycosyltransferase FtsW [Roseomonas sp. CECT 9278]CAH0237102.1 putative peptidoglycan glycosyltransferase FtsW [Roseomonas sp. CECT 9278]